MFLIAKFAQVIVPRNMFLLVKVEQMNGNLMSDLRKVIIDETELK